MSTTLETRATPALRSGTRWKVLSGSLILCVLHTRADVVGWVSLGEDGLFSGCPRVGSIRRFDHVETALAYVETFIPEAV